MASCTQPESESNIQEVLPTVVLYASALGLCSWNWALQLLGPSWLGMGWAGPFRCFPRVEQIQNTTEKTRKIYIETETELGNSTKMEAGWEDEVILELHVIFLWE